MELNKIDGMSMNIEQTEMEKLKAVFPQCFAEGKLDIDKLLGLCGEYIDNDFEKYKFEWKGKMESLKLAQKRSTGTLRPCKAESVNFDETQNLYIEGDNLEVLKLLQTAYYNKIKMIYIDPPYNTGNDFVYEDDFADPMARYKEVTSQTTKSNPETMGRYHTNWLNMMYPRLRLAANLLKEGVTYDAIAKYLNDENILVPRLYFKYGMLRADETVKEMNMWTRTIINKMVNNEQYTGKLIFGRYKVDKIRGKTATRVPRDQWIITENAHEAIVSDELFNMAKSDQRESRKGVKLGQNLFSGKVICGCCGRSFYTWTKNHVLLCQTPTLTSNISGCYEGKIPEQDLVDLITTAIEFVSSNSVDKMGMVKDEIATTSKELDSAKRELKKEEGRLDRLKLKREKLFHKLMDNQINDDEYMNLSGEIEREQISLEDTIRELKRNVKLITAKKKEKESAVTTYKELGKIKKIDRDVVDRFIEKIIISKEGRVEIKWNFENIFSA